MSSPDYPESGLDCGSWRHPPVIWVWMGPERQSAIKALHKGSFYPKQHRTSPPPTTSPHFILLAVDSPPKSEPNRQGQEVGFLVTTPAATNLICLMFPLSKCNFGEDAANNGQAPCSPSGCCWGGAGLVHGGRKLKYRPPLRKQELCGKIVPH